MWGFSWLDWNPLKQGRQEGCPWSLNKQFTVYIKQFTELFLLELMYSTLDDEPHSGDPKKPNHLNVEENVNSSRI